jgi:Na+/phosphate symporter
MTLTKTIKEHLSKRVQNNELNNESIIELIDLLGTYLNAETISDYSKRTKLSYNGTLQRMGNGRLKTFTLFKTKFVIEND